MSESLRFDETDLLLVNALQISPRAPWSRLHDVVGLDPATLSQRWQRLSEQGLAWTTCYPDLQRWNIAFAYVEIDCAPQTRESIMNELADDRYTLSIEFTTGRRDIFLTVAMADIDAIDRYVGDRIAIVPGVTSTRTHHVRRFFTEGADWRLRALSPSVQQRLAARESHPRDDGPLPRFTSLEQSIITALGFDARRTASSIADELGVSVSAVTRGIFRLLSTRRAALRCDIAHNLSPWNVIAVLWVSAPHNQLEAIAKAMMRLPQVRQCSSIAGEANLMVQSWMRSLGELDTIEQALALNFPGARVLDRWIVSRIPKRLGHVLDRDGLRQRFIPFGIYP